MKLYILLVSLTVVNGQDVFVNVNDGRLRGRIRRVDNVDLEVYLGIPYAEPPVGDLRFQRPHSSKKWQGDRDATWYGPACPQLNMKPQYNVSMDEDCLYLNVFTSARGKTSASLPVMVFIHGGTFLTGSGAFLDPYILAIRGVVMVNINYRLDVLGFLSMGDSSAPGNYGMLDQVMALEWIRDNIVHFGGNSSDVTIVGYSAGSAAVSLHLLSPLSRGLFHKVIAQSGSSMANWAAATPKDAVTPRDMAMTLAGKVNCSGSDSRTVLSCLREVEPLDLINAGKTLTRPPRRLTWSPVVETDYGFLPDLPRTIAERSEAANVPVLLGANKDEYANVVGTVEGSDDGVSCSVFEKKVAEFCKQQYPNHQQQTEKAIESVYLDTVNHRDPLAIRTSYINMLTDFYFMAPAILESELLSRLPGRSPVYLYRLARRPDNFSSPQWQGVTHRVGLYLYMFGVPIMSPQIYDWRWRWLWTDRDKDFTHHVLNMTVSFIRTGNPTPFPVNGLTWKPFTTYEKNYAYLDLQPSLKSDLRPRDMLLWNRDIPRILTDPVTSSVARNIPNLFVIFLLLYLAIWVTGDRFEKLLSLIQ